MFHGHYMVDYDLPNALTFIAETERLPWMPRRWYMYDVGLFSYADSKKIEAIYQAKKAEKDANELAK